MTQHSAKLSPASLQFEKSKQLLGRNAASDLNLRIESISDAGLAFTCFRHAAALGCSCRQGPKKTRGAREGWWGSAILARRLPHSGGVRGSCCGVKETTGPRMQELRGAGSMKPNHPPKLGR